jgi:formylglycine-generating enzyme required for sulfatase activity
MHLQFSPLLLRIGAAALAVAAAGLAMVDRPWDPYVAVPGGSFRAGSPEAGPANPPRHLVLAGFKLGRTEVTCSDYALFLNATTSQPAAGAHQFMTIDGRYYAREVRRPVAWVSRADAEAYCRWITRTSGRHARLPTADEWECAARGGIAGARFPWGWGGPEGRACFHAEGPARVALAKPNRFGLHDMAGNVAEWCSDGDAAGRSFALGGSWADRDPDFLRVFHRAAFPDEYRDGDVGFRVLVEDATRDR